MFRITQIFLGQILHKQNVNETPHCDTQTQEFCLFNPGNRFKNCPAEILATRNPTPENWMFNFTYSAIRITHKAYNTICRRKELDNTLNKRRLKFYFATIPVSGLSVLNRKPR